MGKIMRGNYKSSTVYDFYSRKFDWVSRTWV